MITIEYHYNPSMFPDIAHYVGAIDKFTNTTHKVFNSMQEALNFFNECLFPLTSLEEIISCYNKQLKENKREIKQLFYNN